MTTITERYQRRVNQDSVDSDLEMKMLQIEGFPDVMVKLSGANADIGTLLGLVSELTEHTINIIKERNHPTYHDVIIRDHPILKRVREVVG